MRRAVAEGTRCAMCSGGRSKQRCAASRVGSACQMTFGSLRPCSETYPAHRPPGPSSHLTMQQAPQEILLGSNDV